MDDNINSVLLQFLNTDTKFHYLNYHYQKMLDETNDEAYVYKLECLYEWWDFIERGLVEEWETTIPTSFYSNSDDYDSDY